MIDEGYSIFINMTYVLNEFILRNNHVTNITFGLNCVLYK